MLIFLGPVTTHVSVVTSKPSLTPALVGDLSETLAFFRLIRVCAVIQRSGRDDEGLGGSYEKNKKKNLAVAALRRRPLIILTTLMTRSRNGNVKSQVGNTRVVYKRLHVIGDRRPPPRGRLPIAADRGQDTPPRQSGGYATQHTRSAAKYRKIPARRRHRASGYARRRGQCCTYVRPPLWACRL